MTLPGRDDAEADALLTDRYLESLLAADDRRAADAPADASLDRSVRDAATRLRRNLVRVHPSFRFEERLAGRLSDVARSMRLAPAAGGGATVAIRPVDRNMPPADFDPLADPDDNDDTTARSRPLLIGGALTSAALSIAGAAFVAWRRTRPARSPMARAVRAAHAERLRSGVRTSLRERAD
ncbi:MAG: hypothetical protein WEF51_00345 [Chloroflexota bacterium]